MQHANGVRDNRAMADATSVQTLSIQLPPQKAQLEANEEHWARVVHDPDLARFEGRIETDRHGHVIMTPPAGPQHGRLQARIAHLLQVQTADGSVLTECPMSTADGVRAADVAWASPERVRELGKRAFFSRAPEVCVEVRSPRQTDAELREKAALFFDAGAHEAWICSLEGAMTFFRPGDTSPRPSSELFPDFPTPVTLTA
jgi:Uma2 family endonuclease